MQSIPVIHGYGPLCEAFREPLAVAFPERELRVLSAAEDLAAAIAEIEVLIAMRPPRGLWGGAKRLRMIQLTGAGVDSLLPAPYLARGVQIANARGVHAGQMSEYALAMMLAFTRRIPRALEQQREHRWQLFGARRLAGKTVGILGMGAIGEAVAAKSKLLGMRVLGTQRTPKRSPHADHVLAPDQTEQVVREADFLVVLLPLTEETRGLLGGELLGAMKASAVLINMARGAS